jgi:hypothetical protein
LSGSSTGPFAPEERGPDGHWIGGLSGLQSRSGRVENKKFPAPAGIRTSEPRSQKYIFAIKYKSGEEILRLTVKYIFDLTGKWSLFTDIFLLKLYFKKANLMLLAPDACQMIHISCVKFKAVTNSEPLQVIITYLVT